MTIVDPDTTSAEVLAPTPTRSRDPLARLPASARFTLYGIMFVLILTLAEQISDQSRLTAANTWSSALKLTIPIALAGLGGLWSERAGIVNIGLEGMMILGSFFGAWGCLEFGPWQGVVLGVLGGAAGGLVHATATVGFGVDHIVSGVAVNILAVGVTQFLGFAWFQSTNQSPQLPAVVPEVRVPGLHDLIGVRLTGPSLLVWMLVLVAALVVAALRLHPRQAFVRPVVLGVLGVLVVMCLIDLAPWLDEQERFGVSELGRIVQGLTGEVSLIVVMGVVAFPLTAFLLWSTKFGLRLRSVGEDPVAAESLGVAVYRMKVIATTVSGGLAGLGGVSLVYLFANQYRAGQTNGRGYIGLAAMIFGNWRPGGLALGAGLFGFTDTLSLLSDEATSALPLVVALGTVVLLVRALITGRWVSSLLIALTGAGVYLWYLAIDELPGEIVVFLPHLTTLLVLTFASQRLRPPAADGQPYRRGESG